MKSLIFILAFIAPYLVRGQALPSPGGLIPNPGFQKTGCPWGMSSYPFPGCEMKAPPWYCIPPTSPDGWSSCDTILQLQTMPQNQFGYFPPLKDAVGFYNYLPGNDPLYPEWMGTPLLKPLNAGCSFKLTIMVQPAHTSAKVGGFYAVLGTDTFPIQPSPAFAWQTINVTGTVTTTAWNLHIGGYTGSYLPGGGFLNSSYIFVGAVSLFRTGC